MTEGPVLLKLLNFSIPIIFSSVLQLLFNTADIIVVGRFAGEVALAAVGSTSSLINLLVNLFIGLSIGANVVCAHFYGARDEKQISETVETAMALSLLSGFLLTVIGMIGTRIILKLMLVPDEVLPLSTVYLQFYFAGITSTMVYNFASAILRAKGDTRRPLFALMLSGVINVILNLIFVIFFKMSVRGVALATVISQTIAALIVSILLMKEEGAFKLNLRKLHISREILIKIIKVGLPAGLQGIIFASSNVIIQSQVNSFGSVVIAGNSASSSIEGFVYLSMNGLSQGSLTFASQNCGAGKISRIKKLFFVSQASEIVIGLLLGLSAVIFSTFLLGIYSDNPEVILSGKVRLKMICTLYTLCGLMDCTANLIRGTGHSVLPMVVTLVGACGIRLLWIFSIFQIPAFHTLTCLYLSYPVSWTITYLVHVFCFVKIYRRMV